METGKSNSVTVQNKTIAQPMNTADAEWLARAVPGLSPELREVVLLAYAHGLTREQIAQTLSIPVGTVKTRLRAAVLQMSALLATPRRAAP